MTALKDKPFDLEARLFELDFLTYCYLHEGASYEAAQQNALRIIREERDYDRAKETTDPQDSCPQV